jgi:hypothetical protein
MTDWFNNLTKSLADETLPRRQAIRRIAGLLAGGVLASGVPGQVFAQDTSKHRHTCQNPGTCSNTTFPQCGHNEYGNCYCFQRIGTQKGVCACNTYCNCDSQDGRCFGFCTKQSDCGRGFVCISNTGCGCTTGFCVQLCTKTCQLQANRTGRTAA